MGVRSATVMDVPALVGLAKAMHAESGFAGLDFNENIMAATFLELLGQGQFLAVYEREGRIVGGYAGYLSRCCFGADLMAHDYGVFVAPEARGSRAAWVLAKAFVAWAKQAGAKQIRPGVSTGGAGVGAEALYAKLGFRRVGALFAMEV
ncbi:GNAT family N-acetyltransferase [Methylomagnum ishizawai]|uniref:GNAT family N-acetyltransferase n=1 Tax=Methylomagnum ishizawai TaxID=1760988 RepID=UPI001C33537E|nr:GNAT family N-acetyltransferase [Methylomagnum ishizawai]BBL74187.1 hypothetical protein MishRS11D_12850 [Methylomagnum ishizawai]